MVPPPQEGVGLAAHENILRHQFLKENKHKKNELMEILTDLRPDVEFEGETALIDGGVLDSLDIVTLVTELNDAFDIEIRPSDLVPANFNSVEAMLALVEKLQD